MGGCGLNEEELASSSRRSESKCNAGSRLIL
jgi:hypothetical protein